MPNYTASQTMNTAKADRMRKAAALLEELEAILDDSLPDPRLAAVAKTQLEIAAAMYNKAIAFGLLSE